MIFVSSVRRALLKLFVPRFIWPKSVVIDGLSVPLRSAPYSYGIKNLLKKGEYENAERFMVNNFVIAGDCVFEMGGSIGILTAIIAEKIGPSGRLLSIEADEKLVSYSSTWLSRYPTVTIKAGYGYPVYSVSGFIRSRFHRANGSLGGYVEYNLEKDDSSGPVNASRPNYFLKDFYLLLSVNPTVLIIDIEGAEVIVNHVAPCIPSTIRLVLIELHPGMYGHSVELNVISVFESSGFYVSRKLENVYALMRATV
jgi:hypothetical protein